MHSETSSLVPSLHPLLVSRQVSPSRPHLPLPTSPTKTPSRWERVFECDYGVARPGWQPGWVACQVYLCGPSMLEREREREIQELWKLSRSASLSLFSRTQIPHTGRPDMPPIPAATPASLPRRGLSPPIPVPPLDRLLVELAQMGDVRQDAAQSLLRVSGETYRARPCLRDDLERWDRYGWGQPTTG
jgi:hypothetical protein